MSTPEATPHKNSRRRFLKGTLGLSSASLAAAPLLRASAAEPDSPDKRTEPMESMRSFLSSNGELQAASARFSITPEIGPDLTGNYGVGGPRVEKIVGPLKTTATLLDDGRTRVFLIMADTCNMANNVGRLFRRVLGEALGIPPEQVLFFSSHNHSDFLLARNATKAFGMPPHDDDEADLLPIGRTYLDKLLHHARELQERLEPVTAWWAQGEERRISYNRKGYRADGSTYLMREEDRVLQGADYNGDMDPEAPVVVLKNDQGKVVSAIVQFTGHPVTGFSAETPIVFGDFPQAACDHLSKHLSGGGGGAEVPVGFLQGCAGDINAKEMLTGGVERANEFGRMLGGSYVDALPSLKKSERPGLSFAHAVVDLPLAPLPGLEELEAEIGEIEDFIRRASAGDEDTLECVGLNFPHALSPSFRAYLVEQIKPWTEWALQQRRAGTADELPRSMPMDLWVLRIGDVGIAGMPCEPFLCIGRQMREGSRLPLTIPCGFLNYGMGYIPDGPNIGDREYMSSFHRYTAQARYQSKPRPPLAAPGGDVLADKAVELMNRMAAEA